MNRGYVLSLMKDEKRGFPHVLVKGVLCVLSWVYGIAVRIVGLAYRTGIRRQYQVDVPVVSVGNITLGGTGKTPFSAAIAKHFLEKKKDPAVLIRGYGNDEDRMLKNELTDIPVFSGQDRIAGAGRAISKGRDILILDDGFQHRRIKRDLNILLLDCAMPFGNGHVLPRGILRESVFSVMRADMIVLTKTDRADTEQKKNTLCRLEKITPGKPVIESCYRPVSFTDTSGVIYPVDVIRKKRVCLLCGIADPDYFIFLIQQMEVVLAACVKHEDHHEYVQKDIDDLCRRCETYRVDMIVLTGKDYIKVKELDISAIKDKLFILNIEVEITRGKEQFIGRLDSVISG